MAGQGFDVDEWSQLLADLDPAMVIVTVASDGERSGCLVGFHTQCSIDPPRYALWLSKANHTHRLGIGAAVLAVHALSAHDHELAELFGSETGDEVDKFAACDWHPGEGGVPLLDDLPHRFVGRRIITLEGDGRFDHSCVVIEPIDVERGPELSPIRLSDVSDLSPGHPA